MLSRPLTNPFPVRQVQLVAQRYKSSAHVSLQCLSIPFYINTLSKHTCQTQAHHGQLQIYHHYRYAHGPVLLSHIANCAFSDDKVLPTLSGFKLCMAKAVGESNGQPTYNVVCSTASKPSLAFTTHATHRCIG